jgi:hypothetical protein
MKISRVIFLLVLAVLMVGCNAFGSVKSPVAATFTTASIAQAAPSLTPIPSNTAFPTSEAVNTPAPGKITATPENTATTPPKSMLPEGLVAPVFQDCAVAPGWVGCDKTKPAIGGRIALYDQAKGGVAVLDLLSGAGAQMVAKINRLSWSLAGDQLLVGQPSGDGPQSGQQSVTQYQVYTPDLSSPQSVPDLAGTPRWQPNNQLGSERLVISAKGSQARLEYTADSRWLLHVTSTGGQEQAVNVESQPTDKLYSLVSWVGDTPSVLAQTYYASNAAMLVGGQLVVLDSNTGEQRLLDPVAPLDERASFRWSPTSPWLAFVTTGGGEVMDTRRLALIDFSTYQPLYPLPQGLAVNDLLWVWNGEDLLFTAVPQETLAPEAKNTFTGPGVYNYNLSNRTTQLMFTTPPGAIAGLLGWSSDLSTLVYALATPQADGSTLVDVHARKMDTGEDWVLVQGVPGPAPVDGEIAWETFLAYGRK